MTDGRRGGQFGNRQWIRFFRFGLERHLDRQGVRVEEVAGLQIDASDQHVQIQRQTRPIAADELVHVLQILSQALQAVVFLLLQLLAYAVQHLQQFLFVLQRLSETRRAGRQEGGEQQLHTPADQLVL